MAKSSAVGIIKEVLCEFLDYYELQSVCMHKNIVEFGLSENELELFLLRLRETFCIDFLSKNILINYPTVAAIGRIIDNFHEERSLPTFCNDYTMETSRPTFITGASCQLAGNQSSFCGYSQLLLSGSNPIAQFPAARNFSGRRYLVVGGFIENAEYFDANFFEISPREATVMDPKQRLLLMSAFAATENAATTLEKINSKQVAVLVASWSNDYAPCQSHSGRVTATEIGACSEAVSAGRISYFFDISGPAINVDTSSSGAAVVVHLSKILLNKATCDLAICAAANLCFDAKIFDAFRASKILSKSGLCQSFDVDADGYVRSEFVAALVLENPSATHSALAIIGGSASNQDGRTSSLFAPDLDAQVSVALTALRNDVIQSEVHCVEAHATGTALGDATELKSMCWVHAKPLYMCSVKSVLGHAEACAGIAAILRVVSTFQTGLSVNLHLKCLRTTQARNTIILPFIGSSNQINTVASNCYGLSGTNVSMVLNHNRPHGHSGCSSNPKLLMLPISTKSRSALDKAAQRMSLLVVESPCQLAAIAARAISVLQPFRYRLMSFGFNRNGLSKFSNVAPSTNEVELLSWLYSGTRRNAGRYKSPHTLYNVLPFIQQLVEEYEKRIERVSEPSDFNSCGKWNFLNCGHRSKALSVTEAQLYIFGWQYVLSMMWDRWLSTPDVVMGHSFGEYMAATTAGITLLQDTCYMTMVRGLLLQQKSIGGQMLAVNCGQHGYDRLLSHWPNITVACLNSPTQIVLSATSLSVYPFLNWCGFRPQFVNSIAFHSPVMEKITHDFVAYISQICFSRPKVRFVSSLTGVEMPEINANYWSEQMVRPVAFCAAVIQLSTMGVNSFLEVGHEPILCGIVKECLYEKSKTEQFQLLSTLTYNIEDWVAICSTLSRLFMSKRNITNWNEIDTTTAVNERFHFFIPEYPFDLEHYWIGKETNNYSQALRSSSPEKRDQNLHQGGNGKLSGMSKNEITAMVENAVRNVLHLNNGVKFNPDQGFMDIGLDSVMFEELREEIQKAIGSSLSSTFAFDNPTISAVVEYLENYCSGNNISTLKTNKDTVDKYPESKVSIIGLAANLPNTSCTISSLINSLLDGEDCVCDIPADRFNVDYYYSENINTNSQTMYVKKAALLARSVALFDNQFFNVSPKEAKLMDPQQRLLLQTVWHSMENSGLAQAHFNGRESGIFVGNLGVEYNEYEGQNPSGYDATARTPSVLSGRIAYFLGTQGPALTINTACSSSLVALQLALAHIRTLCVQSEHFVAGSDLCLSVGVMISRCKSRMLSFDCHCKTMDYNADGYVRGEGCGCVIIQPVEQDHSTSFAIVLNSVTNQDGRSSGLTAPNGIAQQKLLQKTLCNVNNIGYVELHGTGTALGDPIEFNALRRELLAASEHMVTLGSSKANIGHAEGAAGIAGVLKLILSIRETQIMPHRNWSKSNKRIDLDDSSTNFPLEGSEWRMNCSGTASSFGLSGTNCCALLTQSYSEPHDQFIQQSNYIFHLSARSGNALKSLINSWENSSSRLLETSDIASLTYALCFRSHFKFRAAKVVSSLSQLISQSESMSHHEQSDAQICYVLTGQGAEYSGMGTQLFEEFDQYLLSCHALAEETNLALDLSDLRQLEQDNRRVQIALFCLEYSLAQIWKDWGVVPDMMIGHSLGEIIAAALGGVMELEDTIRLLTIRGKMIEINKGLMFAVKSQPEWAIDFASHMDFCWLSVTNARSSCVLSLESHHRELLLNSVHEMGIQEKFVNNYGFHCPLLAEASNKFYDIIKDITFYPSHVPIFSNITGEMLSTVDADYWRRQICNPVQFHACVIASKEALANSYLEIGPHPVLLPLVSQTVHTNCLFPTLKRNYQDLRSILESAAGLYCFGIDITSNRCFHKRLQGKEKASWKLPNYKFDQQPYWIEKSETDFYPATVINTCDKIHPMLGKAILIPENMGYCFQNTIIFDETNSSCLLYFNKFDLYIIPASTLLDMMYTAILNIEENVHIQHLTIPHFSVTNVAHTFVELQKPYVTQTWCNRVSKNCFTVNLYISRNSTLKLCASAQLIVEYDCRQTTTVLFQPLSHQKLNKYQFYNELCHAGIKIGSDLQTVSEINCGDNKMLNTISTTDFCDQNVLAGVIDGIFQSILYRNINKLYVMFTLKNVNINNTSLYNSNDFAVEINELANTKEQIYYSCTAISSVDNAVVLEIAELACLQLSQLGIIEENNDRKNDVVEHNQKITADVLVKHAAIKTLELKSDDLVNCSNLTFFNLGFDSLTLFEFVNEINTKLPKHVKLSTSDLYANDTIEMLGRFLNENFVNCPEKAGSYNVQEQIISVNKLDSLPLTSNQQQLWVLFQLENEVKYKHNEVLQLKFKYSDRWNQAIFQHIFSSELQTHTSLRTSFCSTRVSQVIKSLTESNHVLVLGEWQGDKRLTYIDRYYSFQLTDDCIAVRTRTMKVNNCVIVTLCIQHILTDGWSFKLFLNDISNKFSELVTKGTMQSGEKLVQYADYAVWQNKWLKSNEARKQLEYWATELDNYSRLELSTDKTKPIIQSHGGNNIFTKLNPATEHLLNSLSKQLNLSVFSMVAFSYSLLMSDRCCQHDILYGVYTSTRKLKELEFIMGYFVNYVPFRSKLHIDATLLSNLDRMKTKLQGFHDSLEIPFAKIVERLGTERTKDAQPLVQVQLNVLFENDINWNDAIYWRQSDRIHLNVSLFPLTTTVMFWKKQSYTGITLEYDSDLFYASTIRVLTRTFAHSLRGMSLMSHRITSILQNIAVTRSFNENIKIERNFVDVYQSVLFRSVMGQSKLVGERVFLSSMKSELSWKLTSDLLIKQSHMLAQLNMTACWWKVTVDSTIAVCMAKSVECVSALLTTIACGMPFVTLDISHPIERIRTISTDSCATLTLRDTPKSRCTPTESVHLEHVETIRICDPYAKTTGSDVLYAIYTSGTTGKPKGIAVNSRTLMNLLFCFPLEGADKYSIHCDSVLLQSHNFIFDGGLCDIFTASVSGAILYLCKDLLQPCLDIRSSNATCTEIAIAIINELSDSDLDTFISLEHMYHGGSALEQKPLNYLLSNSTSTFNSYGPTECTIDTTKMRGNLGNNAQLIGTPFTNYVLLIEHVNGSCELPVGHPGQLLVGGNCLARGYYNQPQKTSEAFGSRATGNREIGLRFSTRFYHTGDLVKKSVNGSLLFCGRNDFQIKLRGQRIELGEIERAVTSHPTVSQAVAFPVERSEKLTEIVVCYASSNACLDLDSFVARLLPMYMVPSDFVHMDSLPLNASMKVDRCLLHAYASKRYQNNQNDTDTVSLTIHSTEMDDTKKRLISIWQEVLGHSKFNCDSIFFNVGGNSINALAVVNKVQDLCSTFSIRDVFECQSINQLQQRLSFSTQLSIEQILSTIREAFYSTALADDDSNESVYKNGADVMNLIQLHNLLKTTNLHLPLSNILSLGKPKLMAKAATGLLSPGEVKWRNSTIVPLQAQNQTSGNILFLETMTDFGYLNCRQLLEKVSASLNIFSCHNRPWLQTEQSRDQQSSRLIDFFKFSSFKLFPNPQQVLLGGHSAGGMLAHYLAAELTRQNYGRSSIILLDSDPCLKRNRVKDQLEIWSELEDLFPRSNIEECKMSGLVLKHGMHMCRLFLEKPMATENVKIFYFFVDSAPRENIPEWQSHSYKQIAVDSINGRHLTLFHRRYNAKLCTKINAILAEHKTHFE